MRGGNKKGQVRRLSSLLLFGSVNANLLVTSAPYKKQDILVDNSQTRSVEMRRVGLRSFRSREADRCDFESGASCLLVSFALHLSKSSHFF